MTKLTLTYVNRTPRTSRTGKPFISLSIKATEHGDKYLSGFGNKANEGWQVGQEVEVAEIKEVIKDGKVYLNFEMPSNKVDNSEVSAKLDQVLSYLAKQSLLIAELVEDKRKHEKVMIQGTDIPYPQPEDEGINLDEPPF